MAGEAGEAGEENVNFTIRLDIHSRARSMRSWGGRPDRDGGNQGLNGASSERRYGWMLLIGPRGSFAASHVRCTFDAATLGPWTTCKYHTKDSSCCG